MLVAQQRRATVAPPPLRELPSVDPTGQKVVERYREGMWVETPKGPSVKLLVDERATEAVLDFPRDTKVGCTIAIRPQEGEGKDSKGEESGPGPP